MLVIRRHPRVFSLLLTWKASAKSGRFVRVSFDGVDWIHRWRGGALVWHQPLLEPVAVTEADLPLFTHRYRPLYGDVLIDVGAGAGAELGPLARMVGRSGHVVAVEPDPMSFRRLLKLVRILGLQNVTLRQTAIGSTEGMARLTQDNDAGVTNHIDTNATGGISVPLTTLDALLDELSIGQVDYLKMNIEGSERAALLGFRRHARKVRNWCIGCHDFLGTPEMTTLSFVTAWLEAEAFSVSRHAEVAGSPWAGWYVYAEPAPGQSLPSARR